MLRVFIPTPKAPGPQPSRRGFLAALALGATALSAGCGVRIGQPSDPSTAKPSVDADLGIRLRVAAASQGLATAATQLSANIPGSGVLLRSIAAAHTAHAAALRPVGAAASPSPSIPAVTSLAALALAERTAATALEAELLNCLGPTARLLSSIRVRRFAHADLLEPTNPKVP